MESPNSECQIQQKMMSNAPFIATQDKENGELNELLENKRDSVIEVTVERWI